MSAMSQPRPPAWTRQDASVTWRWVGEEVVMLDTRDSRYHSLNRIGARLWEWLAKPTSSANLIDRIVTEFNVDRAVAERDVRDYLVAMRGLELVEELG